MHLRYKFCIVYFISSFYHLFYVAKEILGVCVWDEDKRVVVVGGGGGGCRWGDIF